MEFGVLGPLAVSTDGEPVPLRSTKQRILLAMLLSHANTQVSQRRLMEALWDTPPASAAENLRLYVHQLRRALGNGNRITRGPSGYAITVNPGELDAQVFDDGATEGSRVLAAGDPGRASSVLTEALSLWRGSAYGDLADAPVIRQAALRLEEARLRAIEERVAADLELGRHADQVAELINLAEAHPFREPLRAHLMWALYGAGRQAEALEVYRQTRGLLIEQLGIEPGPELRRLHAAILRGEQAPPARAEQVLARAEDPCPYQGLTTFEPEHRRWFFGRTRLVERLTGQVERFPVVGVLGASGSGKSSLLRAGVLGSLAGEPAWRTMLLTPTEHPMDALAAAFPGGSDDLDIAIRTSLAGGPDGTRYLIVVDQFEEVFTLCADPAERARFIDALLGAALGDGRRATVVLGIRADFLAHITQHAGLVSALEHEATLLVGPPSATDLREIIVRPAAEAGLTVDADLLATALADLGSEPGALPLLSHALLETWRNRSGRGLTLAAYQASGGVRGAIAQSAEQVYDGLTEPQRQAVRRIFLRLTALGSGTEDTRRRVSRAELAGIAQPQIIEGVLDRLAAARLVVLGEHGIEVAHEALIRAWPRLHRWLFDDRANLLVHRRLTAAAQTWRELEEDPGALYRGARLATTTAWAEDHPRELNETEDAFLRASRSLEEGERTAARRRAGLLKGMVATLAVLLVLALLGIGFAMWQSEEAQRRQTIERSHQLALTARQLLDTAPDLAGLLAIEAYRLHPDPDTRGALLSSASAARRRVDLNIGGTSVFSVAFNPDGSLLASANRAGTVDVWDVAHHTRLFTLSEHTSLPDAYARTVAFDHSGQLIASTARLAGLESTAGSLLVWDTRTRQPVLRQRIERLTNAMAFSQDGTTVAVGGAGGAIEVWDVAANTRRVLTGHRFEVDSLAISPDRRFLVSSNTKEEPIVWDLAAGTRLATVPAQRVNAVAFGSAGDELTTSSVREGVRFWSLDGASVRQTSDLPLQTAYAWDISAPLGDRIAVADEYGLITIWDIRRRTPIETYQDRGRAETRSLALGGDGTLLAAGGLGRTVTIRTHAIPPFSGHGGAVDDLVISPNGTLVASAGADRTVRVWDLSGNPLAVLGEHADRVEAVAWSPDGRQVAALTRNHTITIWDVEHRARLSSVAYEGLGASTDIAYSPDNRSIVTASSVRFRFDRPGLAQRRFPGAATVATAIEFTVDGRFLVSTDPAGGILVWDWAADREAFHVATGQGDVRDVAVSRDGTMIATAGADRTVKLWNAHDGKEIAVLSGHTAPAQVVAFSPDGRTLASAGEDRAVLVWDIPTRSRTATLTGHPAPVQSLTFTPSGDLLSGSDRIIRYTLSPDAAITRICTEVARNLTPAEWDAYLAGEPHRDTCVP